MTTDPDPPAAYDAPWTASSPCTEVVAAFVAAVSSMEDVSVDKKVDAGPMKYKYATLGAVLDEVRPKLRAEGLTMTQVPTDFGVFTTIFHKSGQWISFPPLNIRPAGGTPQNVGSAISYARRYSILSICNLATEDDDGHAAAVAPRPAASTRIPADAGLTRRVDEVLDRLTHLSDAEKLDVKGWASKEGRKLSGKSMFEDHDWLAMVESYLDVLSDRSPLDDELDPDDTPADPIPGIDEPF